MILGIANGLRIPPEYMEFGGHGDSAYLRLLAIDLVIAFLTAGSGVALLKGGKGSVRLAWCAAGLTLPSALFWGIFLGQGAFDPGSYSFLFRILPRMICYVCSFALWPGILRSLSKQSRERLGPQISWFVVFAALSAGAIARIYFLR